MDPLRTGLRPRASGAPMHALDDIYGANVGLKYSMSPQRTLAPSVLPQHVCLGFFVPFDYWSRFLPKYFTSLLMPGALFSLIPGPGRPINSYSYINDYRVSVSQFYDFRNWILKYISNLPNNFGLDHKWHDVWQLDAAARCASGDVSARARIR